MFKFILYIALHTGNKYIQTQTQTQTQTLLSEIELIHFSVLSSRDLNYHNDIQLFLQQFEKFSVCCVTN